MKFRKKVIFQFLPHIPNNIHFPFQPPITNNLRRINNTIQNTIQQTLLNFLILGKFLNFLNFLRQQILPIFLTSKKPSNKRNSKRIKSNPKKHPNQSKKSFQSIHANNITIAHSSQNNKTIINRIKINLAITFSYQILFKNPSFRVKIR